MTKSVACWQRAGILPSLFVVIDPNISFASVVCVALQQLDAQPKVRVTLQCIWKHQNDNVWNNTIEFVMMIC